MAVKRIVSRSCNSNGELLHVQSVVDVPFENIPLFCLIVLQIPLVMPHSITL